MYGIPIKQQHYIKVILSAECSQSKTNKIYQNHEQN
jgi:hypothetical protein